MRHDELTELLDEKIKPILDRLAEEESRRDGVARELEDIVLGITNSRNDGYCGPLAEYVKAFVWESAEEIVQGFINQQNQESG